jgi:hypothetical protein
MGEALLRIWQTIGPVVFPIIWSSVVTLACTAVFWTIRWWYGLDRGHGTEVFAILFAVDLSVLFGAVEAWRLTSEVLPISIYRAAALVLMLATVILCVLSVVYDRQAQDELERHDRALAERASRPQLRQLRSAYRRWTLIAYMIRWATVNFHLWWIIKTPRWVLMQ